MKISQIEESVLRIIDRVVAGRGNEDSVIEFKRNWLADECRMARGIAALCNAAGGGPVMLIVGVDENGVFGSPLIPDQSRLLPRLERYFDGVMPRIIDIVVPYGSEAVTVLYME